MMTRPMRITTKRPRPRWQSSHARRCSTGERAHHRNRGPAQQRGHKGARRSLLARRGTAPRQVEGGGGESPHARRARRLAGNSAASSIHLPAGPTTPRLFKAEEHTRPHRMLTSEAAELIPDGSLDFVYVDARHDYCGCLKDLETYWPKLRPGGLMAGHDYVDASQAPSSPTAPVDWTLCAGAKGVMASPRHWGGGCDAAFARQNRLRGSGLRRRPSLWPGDGPLARPKIVSSHLSLHASGRQPPSNAHTRAAPKLGPCRWLQAPRRGARRG